MPQASARLFLALWPDASDAERLAQLAAAVVARQGGRACQATNIHLTLAFLGDVPCDRIPILVTALAEIRFKPFRLCLDQLLAWPRQHIAWAGCQQTPAELLLLVSRLHEVLAEQAFKFDRTHASFTPHLTLVRNLTSAGQPQVITPPITWCCEHFSLVSAQLGSGGSVYRSLATFSAKSGNIF